MYEVLPETTPELLAVRVSGTLGTADYAGLEAWLDARLAAHRCPALLVVMEGFEGWDSLGAAMADFRLCKAHHDDLRRVALVGQAAWQKLMARIAAPFVAAELRYFDYDEQDVARFWVQTGHDGPASPRQRQ